MKVLDLYGTKTTIQTFDDAKLERPFQRIFMYDDARCKELNDLGAGVYWTVNLQEKENQRGIDNTCQFSCIGMDCDVTKETDGRRGITRLPEEEVQSLKPNLFNKLVALTVPPSGILETRNGLQPYWVFTNPQELKPEQRKTANVRYQDYIRGITKVTGIKSEGDNLQRVLRMPGYFHKKTDQPFLIKDIFEEGKPCDFEAFKKAYPPIAKTNSQSNGKIDPVANNQLRLEDVPVQQALETLSGMGIVNKEKYSFRKNSNGSVQILVNEQPTSQWIDSIHNTIGGGGQGQGNPTIIQWLSWYFKKQGDNNKLAHAKAYQTLFPLLLPSVPESQWKKTKAQVAKEKPHYDYTDTTNAEYFVKCFGDKVRYDHLRQRWLIWNGHIWARDTDAEVERLCKEAIRLMYKEAGTKENESINANLAEHAIKSESETKRKAMLSLAKTEKPIADDGLNWDKNPWLFACANGIIDLRTGQLREGKPDDRITMKSPINYNPSASRPRFLLFLSEVFEDDEELIRYVGKALGYSLSGDMREQIFFVCFGSGGNGKSKLFDSVRHVMGDYAMEASSITFYEVFHRNNNFELPNLENKRLVTVAESNENSALDIQRVKGVTGGDPITAAAKHKNDITFQPACKLWMYFNNKPTVSDSTKAIWQRIKPIRFGAEFRGKPNEDKNILDKLKSESEGILAWLVEQCLLWQKEGLLPEPASVTENNTDYQIENDPLQDFISEECVVGENMQVSASELFEKYNSWAFRSGLNGKDKLDIKKFTNRMSSKFLKVSHGNRKYYKGLGLRSLLD